jgi:hypothetical protein
MACKGCIDVRDKKQITELFVWNGAIVALIACDRHKKEITESLGNDKRYEGIHG